MTYYRDVDGDGYGDARYPMSTCLPIPAGHADNGDDCNDGNADINPGATEICDDIDNNCDSRNNEGLDAITYYRDLDGDGYGDARHPMSTCLPIPADHADNGDDCNDGNADINPGATEICDDIDNNCDSRNNEGLDIMTFYRDVDGDGYGDARYEMSTCLPIPAEHADNGDDCNDMIAAINPGATEICDGEDNDCDGRRDEEVLLSWYPDGDRDGYGNASASAVTGCTVPSGSVENNRDCDDMDAAINPAALELCDGEDNDCNGSTSDGANETSIGDSCDGDDSDACPEGSIVCESGALRCSDTTDDDIEVCDGVDNDCDVAIDEELPMTTFFPDSDGDGYGVDSGSETTCEVSRGGFATETGDCAPDNADVYPSNSSYFSESYRPSRSPFSSPSYDYNCNMTEEQRYTTTSASLSGRCYLDTFGRCTGSPEGWLSFRIPACGSEATPTTFTRRYPSGRVRFGRGYRRTTTDRGNFTYCGVSASTTGATTCERLLVTRTQQCR
jgi:hypothetical protein